MILASPSFSICLVLYVCREMAASSDPPTADQYQKMGHYYHGIGVGLMALKQYEKVEYSGCSQMQTGFLIFPQNWQEILDFKIANL